MLLCYMHEIRKQSLVESIAKTVLFGNFALVVLPKLLSLVNSRLDLHSQVDFPCIVE
jgi:hypothetical protein